jgi:glucose-6-phosphate isomerase
MAGSSSPVLLPSCLALSAHYERIRDVHLRDLFAADPARGRRYSLEAAGLYLDYSKNRVDDETLRLLMHLAEESGLSARIDAMFGGEQIKVTERRAPLHTALRAPKETSIVVNGVNVVPKVHAVLEKMADYAERVRSGAWTGYSGKRLRNVITIGVGGAILGPAMACEALTYYSDRSLTFRFISNVDGSDFAEATRDLDPAETLFIVSSKSFTTRETLTNARWATEWLFRSLPAVAEQPEDPNDWDAPSRLDLVFGAQNEALGRHFFVVSANEEKTAGFTDRHVVDPNNYFGNTYQARNWFEIWDWVEEPYALTSAIGLPLMIAIGPQRFHQMLAGYRAMDEHFRTAPFERNMPVLLALIGIWYHTFFGAETQAVLPYDYYLRGLDGYLRHLDMASNGKHLDLAGDPVSYKTGPIVWGSPGTDAEHAYQQLLHQGTRLIPCDFIGFAETLNPFGTSPSWPTKHHDLLTAHLFAQTATLAFGRTAEEAAEDGTPTSQIPHRTFEGNRPTNTILAPRLTPATLGALFALYEHKVFVQGVIWGINSYDQWDGESANTEALRILRDLEPGWGPREEYDSSTSTLLTWYRARRDAGSSATIE